MKHWLLLLPLAAALALAGSGCAKKSDLKTQTAELEKPFPGLSAAVAAQTQATDQPAPSDARGCVFAAVSAIRRNDPATALILLHKAVWQGGLSPEQLMVVDNARRVWASDLTERAARGDQSAKAALDAVSAGSSLYAEFILGGAIPVSTPSDSQLSRLHRAQAHQAAAAK